MTFDKPLATRQSSQLVLNKLCELVPELVGGSADLTPSNLTKFKVFLLLIFVCIPSIIISMHSYDYHCAYSY